MVCCDYLGQKTMVAVLIYRFTVQTTPNEEGSFAVTAKRNDLRTNGLLYTGIQTALLIRYG